MWICYVQYIRNKEMPLQRKVNKGSGQKEFLPKDEETPVEERAELVVEEHKPLEEDPIVPNDPTVEEQIPVLVDLVPTPSMIEKLSETTFNNKVAKLGEIVYYASDADRHNGAILPGLVTGIISENVLVLQVFTTDTQGMFRATNVRHSSNKKAGTWHFAGE